MDDLVSIRCDGPMTQLITAHPSGCTAAVDPASVAAIDAAGAWTTADEGTDR